MSHSIVVLGQALASRNPRCPSTFALAAMPCHSWCTGFKRKVHVLGRLVQPQFLG